MTKAKRLQPTVAVLRELYLKSGNQCAYPGCLRPIVNSSGNYVGQICHIEAAEPGGERFNPNQSNEERRALSNLLLLCYDHHIETNDVQKFPVHVLQGMKQDHEKKFSDIVGQLQQSISDLTTQQPYIYTVTCDSLNKHLRWNYDEEEIQSVVDIINEWVDKLRKLSPDTRQVFSLILERSSSLYWGVGAIIEEIEEVTGKSSDEIKRHVVLLSKYGFISDPEMDYDVNSNVVYIRQDKNGWDMWFDIKKFCEDKGFDLDEIIVDLNFAKLD